MRRLAILTAAVLMLTGLSSPAWADPSPSATPAADAPATIIYCAYGDNFYRFFNLEHGFLQYIFDGALIDNLGGTSNDQFCQTNVSGGFAEWVKKGTSVCLTLDATISYGIDLKGCVAGKASQLWALVDNIGGENWGGIQSAYTNAGFRYWHDGYDCCGLATQGLQGWLPGDVIWSFGLDGPYR